MIRIPAALAILTAAAPVMAAELGDMPPFPTDRSDAAVFVWLSRNTSLPVGRSVVVQPDNVLVVLTDTPDPAAPAQRRVSFRQEATHIDFVARTGGRSLEGDADIDCATGRTKARSVALYSGTDLRGGQVALQGADPEWRAPFAGTASAIVVAEVCSQTTAPPAAASAPTYLPPVGPPPAPAPTPLPPIGPPPPAAEPPAQTGPFTAQIGAFGSRQAAEAYWAEVAAAFATQLGGRTAAITPVTAGGQTLWRVGVPDLPENTARTLCAALEAAQRGCFVRLD